MQSKKILLKTFEVFFQQDLTSVALSLSKRFRRSPISQRDFDSWNPIDPDLIETPRGLESQYMGEYALMRRFLGENEGKLNR